MLGELDLPILREFIFRISDYKSITNLRLINKRLFKFINNDLVVQKHYLKLRYNLNISINSNLLKLIRILNSKCYTKIVNQGHIITTINAVFVNPSNDSFILYSKTNGKFRHFIFPEDTPTTDKIFDIFSKRMVNLLEPTLISEGYVLLGSEYPTFTNVFRIDDQQATIRNLHSKRSSASMICKVTLK